MLPLLVRDHQREDPLSVAEAWVEQWNRDGMRVCSSRAFDPGQPVWVDLSVNHRPRSGWLRVASSEPSGQMTSMLLSPRDSDGSENADADGWYVEATSDFARTVGALEFAKTQWNGIGGTAKRLILKAASSLPQALDDEQGSRRRHTRYYCGAGADMIVMGDRGWRRLPMHVEDVSEGGIGVILPAEALTGSRSTARLVDVIVEGVAVMAVFGSPPDLVWMPAEVAWRTPGPAGGVRCGLKFITAAALQRFGA